MTVTNIIITGGMDSETIRSKAANLSTWFLCLNGNLCIFLGACFLHALPVPPSLFLFPLCFSGTYS